jgi:hypothetical protein
MKGARFLTIGRAIGSIRAGPIAASSKSPIFSVPALVTEIGRLGDVVALARRSGSSR